MSSDQQQVSILEGGNSETNVLQAGFVELEGGKKRCPTGSRRGSDKKCHRASSKKSSTPKKKTYVQRSKQALSATRKAMRLSIESGIAAECKYYPKNKCPTDGCKWHKASKNRAGVCAKVPGKTRSGLYEYSDMFSPMRNPGTTSFVPLAQPTPEEMRIAYGMAGGRRRRYSMRGGDIEAGQIDGGDIEAGKRGRKIKTPIKVIRSRAKKACVKRSGSKSKILQRIRSAKKSKSATKRRCASKKGSKKSSRRM